MESTISLPIPGIEKITSVIRAPPISCPNCVPITVVIGISAFARACFLVITLSS